MKLLALWLFLHLAGVAIWVGGMFFAYVCLRPVAAELFEPPARLRLWRGVLGRFFFWVWWAAGTVVASGAIMLAESGLRAAPPGWHLMLGSGTLMVVIFVYVVLGPFAVLKQAVANEDWKAAGAALNHIRRMVGINLLLAILTIGFATLGLALP
jgi:uncharacterized membrane protein